MRSHVGGTSGLAVLAGILALATTGWADGFNPSLSPLPVIGESLICSSSMPSPGNCSAANAITVDWAVGFDSGLGQFIYLYGVETNTSTDVASIEIDYTPGALTSDGFVAGTTFDSEASSLFGLSLGKEDESISGTPVDPASVVPLVPGGTTDHVTWGFDTSSTHNLTSGLQSSVLFVTSPLPPVFGFSSSSDAGHGGSPWNTRAVGSNPVPVPGIPEPASVVLLGSALFAIGASARRRSSH